MSVTHSPGEPVSIPISFHYDKREPTAYPGLDTVPYTSHSRSIKDGP